MKQFQTNLWNPVLVSVKCCASSRGEGITKSRDTKNFTNLRTYFGFFYFDVADISYDFKLQNVEAILLQVEVLRSSKSQNTGLSR